MSYSEKYSVTACSLCNEDFDEVVKDVSEFLNSFDKTVGANSSFDVDEKEKVIYFEWYGPEVFLGDNSFAQKISESIKDVLFKWTRFYSFDYSGYRINYLNGEIVYFEEVGPDLEMFYG